MGLLQTVTAPRVRLLLSAELEEEGKPSGPGGLCQALTPRSLNPLL